MIRLSSLREGAVRRLGSSEQRRIDAALRGDRAAFDELRSHHEKAIRRFLLRRLPLEQVDDLLQDVWVAAWSSLSEFDDRSRFRTWLIGIAINKCKNHYRLQQRRIVQVSLDQAPAGDHRRPRVISEVEALLPSLLQSLSENHRQLLDLYYYGELTLPEISRMLDRNLNTVKYQFYRAHAELATLVEEETAR